MTGAIWDANAAGRFDATGSTRAGRQYNRCAGLSRRRTVTAVCERVPGAWEGTRGVGEGTVRVETEHTMTSVATKT